MPAKHDDTVPRVPRMALLGGMFLHMASSLLLCGAAAADGPSSTGGFRVAKALKLTVKRAALPERANAPDEA